MRVCVSRLPNGLPYILRVCVFHGRMCVGEQCNLYVSRSGVWGRRMLGVEVLIIPMRTSSELERQPMEDTVPVAAWC